MLLIGGCGYENFRLFPSVSLDRRFRTAVRYARPGHPSEPMTNWPPYDIERVGDDHYRITLAVAGFSPDEIELTQLENTLVVVGQKKGPGRGEALPAPRHRCAHLQADLQRRRARQGDWRHLRKWTAHHRPRARGSRGTETAPGRDCEGGYGPGQQADRARTQAEQGRVTLLHVNGSAGELRHCRMFDRSPCRAHRKRRLRQGAAAD